mmetsp:Transcript_21072/g.31815  ORF Transcript_21072/g.31815 Transcript_21072/m.31815 type:complete len:121 (-) Transcript_21072:29-391(-)
MILLFAESISQYLEAHGTSNRGCLCGDLARLEFHVCKKENMKHGRKCASTTIWPGGTMQEPSAFTSTIAPFDSDWHEMTVICLAYPEDPGKSRAMAKSRPTGDTSKVWEKKMTLLVHNEY